MKVAGFCSIAAALLLAVGARSQDAIAMATPDTKSVGSDMPYANIVARNMFGLVPIPPPDPNAGQPPVDPPPKITPNGIMTIFGRDQALFKVAAKPKPGQPPKDDSYVLSEGERQDDIEVVKINHVDGIVTFNNHGTIQDLPLLAASAGGAAASPGGPGNAAAGIRPGPSSPVDRMGMRNRQFSPGSAGGGGVGQPNMGANPGSSMGGGQQPAQNIEDQVMSVAREAAEIEQNRIATQDLVDKGMLPPLPPTPLTPSDATGFGGEPLIQNPTGLVPPTPGKK